LALKANAFSVITQTRGHYTVQGGASQIGDKPYRWQVNSVTVNSVTSSRWQVSVSSVTVIIYRQTTFSDPIHLACAYTTQNLL